VAQGADAISSPPSSPGPGYTHRLVSPLIAMMRDQVRATPSPHAGRCRRPAEARTGDSAENAARVGPAANGRDFVLLTSRRAAGAAVRGARCWPKASALDGTTEEQWSRNGGPDCPGPRKYTVATIRQTFARQIGGSAADPGVDGDAAVTPNARADLVDQLFAPPTLYSSELRPTETCGRLKPQGTLRRARCGFRAWDHADGSGIV